MPGGSNNWSPNCNEASKCEPNDTNLEIAPISGVYVVARLPVRQNETKNDCNISTLLEIHITYNNHEMAITGPTPERKTLVGFV